MKPLCTLTKSNFLKLNQCRLPLSTLPDVVWDNDSPQRSPFRAVQNVAQKRVGRSSEPTCRKPKVPLFIHLWCCSVNTPGSLYLVSLPLIMQRSLYRQAEKIGPEWFRYYRVYTKPKGLRVSLQLCRSCWQYRQRLWSWPPHNKAIQARYPLHDLLGSYSQRVNSSLPHTIDIRET